LEFVIEALKMLLLNHNLFFVYLKFRVVRLTPRWIMFRGVNELKDIFGVKYYYDFEYLGQGLGPKQMYFNCYEIATVEFMRKTLQPGDTFIDVGANVGYLTAVGMSIVGKKGEVHSFEPIKEYFNYITKIKESNNEYKLYVNNIALGSKSGFETIDFSKPPHFGGSSIVKGLIRNANRSIRTEKVKIKVKRLDEYIKDNKLKSVSLIKIDVEGYEYSVLKGLQGYFETTSFRPVIICEITPSAYKLLEININKLLEYMQMYGYKPYNIINIKKEIDIRQFKCGKDVVFICKNT